jgi:flagellum-specific peptidoglycan hydrolase FlgJ
MLNIINFENIQINRLSYKIYPLKSKISVFVIILLALILASCGSKKRSVSKPQPRAQTQVPQTEESKVYDKVGKVNKPPRNLNLTESYIYQFADIAKQEMRLFGIPASITLAQGILESGNGQGDLTSRSKNHFGIKCNGWRGAKVYHDDDEAQECFRKYTHAEYSYRDHSLFLFNRSRYGFLFNYKVTDYKAWAKGLKKAGYATDPKYPDKLISLIERYELYKYDEEVYKDMKEGNRTSKNHLKESDTLNKTDAAIENVDTHIVKKGDTLYSISKKYGVNIEKIVKLNNIKNNIISIGQTLKLE